MAARDGRGSDTEGAGTGDEFARVMVEALSPRERTIALGIARGEAYKVVAIANTLSVQFVSTYLPRAKKKLRVKSRAELIQALSRESCDESAVSRCAVIADASSACTPCALSACERNVLQHLVAGLSNAQVAASLGIKPRTVAAHASAVMRKLGVGSRAELIAHILRSDRRSAKGIRKCIAVDGSVCDEDAVSVGKVTMESVCRDDVLCDNPIRRVVVASGGVGDRTDK